MTNEQTTYATDAMKQAGLIITEFYKLYKVKEADHFRLIDQQIALTETLLKVFPMPYVEPPPPDRDDLVPNRPGKWGYCRKGDQAMVSVRVEEAKGGELCYFNDAAGRWVQTEKAEGEWGGYLGPLGEEKS